MTINLFEFHAANYLRAVVSNEPLEDIGLVCLEHRPLEAEPTDYFRQHVCAPGRDVPGQPIRFDQNHVRPCFQAPLSALKQQFKIFVFFCPPRTYVCQSFITLLSAKAATKTQDDGCSKCFHYNVSLCKACAFDTQTDIRPFHENASRRSDALVVPSLKTQHKLSEDLSLWRDTIWTERTIGIPEVKNKHFSHLRFYTGKLDMFPIYIPPKCVHPWYKGLARWSAKHHLCHSARW